MKKAKKLILPLLILITIFMIYTFYFAPNKDTGSFNIFNTNSEINQEIVVKLVANKKFTRNTNGEITSFYVKDKNNKVVLVSSHEGLPESLKKAKLLKLLGHLHSDGFSAAKVTVLK